MCLKGQKQSYLLYAIQDLEDLETDEETDLEEGDDDEQKIQKDEL